MKKWGGESTKFIYYFFLLDWKGQESSKSNSKSKSLKCLCTDCAVFYVVPVYNCPWKMAALVVSSKSTA